MKKQTKPEIFLDHYLSTIGLWRKPIARDGLCLFRAVSEQLFKTQAYHTNLYEACRTVFMHFGKEPLLEWQEHEVMEILSRMYRRDFLVYEAVGLPPTQATSNNYDGKILLCRIGQHQLDSVYPISFQQDAAMCQSIVYEILYRGVFKLDSELTEAVSLIRDQNKKKLSFLSNRFDDFEDTISRKCRDWQTCYRDRYLRKPTPPVPYRIAKALDPTIYRNVELDIWEEEKREQKKESPEYRLRFATGDKCQVILEGEHFHGHIQDISDRDNTAVVFIEEIGEKRAVLISCLKTPPSSKYSCMSNGRYYRRKQDLSVSPASIHSNSYHSNARYSSYSTPTPSDVDFTNNNRSCTSSQRYSLAQTYSYPDTAMTTTGCNYVPMETTGAQDGLSNALQNSRTDQNQRYGPPAIQQQNAMQQNTYMYSTGMVPAQTSSTYSCMCVPYLESIAIGDVNTNCLPSQDLSGKDLPEVNTLRFFFNLGVENYRLICQGGQIWPSMEMTPIMPPANSAVTADQLNGNYCGQFSLPPPPFAQTFSPNGHYPNQQTVAPSNQNNPYHAVTSPGTILDKSNPATTNTAARANKDKAGTKVCAANEEPADYNVDSGCDSDSVSGSAHDDSFNKDVDDKVPLETSAVDLEMKLDNFIAKNNDEINSATSSSDFQVPSPPKNKTKRKYYMYGNLKLIKPIKDIPPRFLTLLAESSAERTRCEGEPIIIPFLPPKPYQKYYNRQNFAPQAGDTKVRNGFNPEAKCFVPGQSSQNIMHDPSIVAYSTDCKTGLPVQTVPVEMGPSAAVPVYVSGSFSHSNSGNGNYSNTVSSCNQGNTNIGDGSKFSMPPSFSTGQACTTYPTPMQYPVYYTGPGPYTGAPGFMPIPTAVPAQGNFQGVNHPAQAFSMPPQVTQMPAVQTA